MAAEEVLSPICVLEPVSQELNDDDVFGQTAKVFRLEAEDFGGTQPYHLEEHMPPRSWDDEVDAACCAAGVNDSAWGSQESAGATIAGDPPEASPDAGIDDPILAEDSISSTIDGQQRSGQPVPASSMDSSTIDGSSTISNGQQSAGATIAGDPPDMEPYDDKLVVECVTCEDSSEDHN